jgi:hypothetical protein
MTLESKELFTKNVTYMSGMDRRTFVMTSGINLLILGL